MSREEAIWQERLRRLRKVAGYREKLREAPELHMLFLELTDCCNLRCLHCGSSCSAGNRGFLDTEQTVQIVRAAAEYEPRVHICLSGGEPMLHPGLPEITAQLKESGVFWSMVSNATLIDAKAARNLKENNIYSVSVSLDGREADHNRMRQSPHAYSQAIRGIRCLRDEGIKVQITTVITKRTLGEMDAIFDIVKTLDAASWKLINVEPIGRAVGKEDMLLGPEEYRTLLYYLRERRKEAVEQYSPMEITYGCSHFLPLEYEEEVRSTLFICGAGIFIAGIRCNGDIAACLDIEPRPELVQGNIYRDDFTEVWEKGFQIFRRDRTAESEKCGQCPIRDFCAGDSLHTWDFDISEPRICIPSML